MGVPKFYRWISERYPCLSEVVKEYQIPDFDNLYLDMNGIIHNCSHPNDEDPHFRISEEQIFLDIFRYIEFLFRIIKPRKVFFMAVDGVAPRAKMNQQRGRRFRTAREAELKEAEAIRKGEVLPTEDRFDSNCITPGTEFMVRLQDALKYFVSSKISTDKTWQNVKVYLSGHETPGEGEHKIMDFIRYHKSQTDYDANTKHCLYGLDADLIMLGLCSHEPHFSLLREEVKFGSQKNQKRTVVPEETTFHLLHLTLMRDYLGHEFSALKERIDFPFDLESLIDDWVLMGFLVGNDFIPHIPQMHIQHDALPVLYQAYIEILPTLGGYINEGGILNLQRFQLYLDKLAQVDREMFNDVSADIKYLEGKKVSYQNDFLSVLGGIEQPGDYADESDDSEGLIDMEFAQHKRDYYMNKMDYENVTKEVLMEQAHEYIRAIQWNLHYYYNGIASWSWYYPHHYAPYISDVKDFANMDLSFELGTPFLPFQQLLGVLPSASKKLLPKPYQRLMVEESSPLKSFYPEDFKTDLNGKQQDWEAVVLIPFIDECLLLSSMDPLWDDLTEDEKRRNRHGPHLLFSYSPTPLGTTIKCKAYNFPEIQFNHAKCQELEQRVFHLPRSKLRKGLCPGARLDVFIQGFPSLRHIPHTAEHSKAKVKVFQHASRGDNMILSIKKQTWSFEDAGKMLGKQIYVNWPHLSEAKVEAISDSQFYIDLGESDSKGKRAMTSDQKAIHFSRCKHIKERCFDRFGIQTGQIEILLHVHLLTGRRFCIKNDGLVQVEKLWSPTPTAVALQTTVQDIEFLTPDLDNISTLEELYPPLTTCFMIGQPCYGCTGQVMSSRAGSNSSRVEVKFATPREPNFQSVMRRAQSLTSDQYIQGFLLAKKLGVSGYLVSRMTGTFFVQTNSLESMAPVKLNIGLNLKFNKRNQEVCGYSKRTEEGQWLYSMKAFEVMREYMCRFPELFENVVDLLEEDVVHVDQLFGKGKGADYMKRVKIWLEAQPCTAQNRQTCGANVLDPAVVKEIEIVVDNLKVAALASQPPSLSLNVKPEYLYKPHNMHGSALPDSSATYELYDRVVYIREGSTVPLGYRGTVIGIHNGDKETEVAYDIVFDNEFVGGVALNCSSKRGYRVQGCALINISFGARLVSKRNVREEETPKKHRKNESRLYSQAVSAVTKQKFEKKESSPRREVPAGQMTILGSTKKNTKRQEKEQEGVDREDSCSTPSESGSLNHFNHSPDSPFVPHHTGRSRDQGHFQFDSPTSDPGSNDLFRGVDTPVSLGNHRNHKEVASQNSQSNKDFTLLWNELKQVSSKAPAANVLPSPQPPQGTNDSGNHKSYGKPIAVEELFQKARSAETSSSSRAKNIALIPLDSSNTELEGKWEKELKEYLSLRGETMELQHVPAGKDSSKSRLVVCILKLSRGRMFSGSPQKNPAQATEDAAQTAITILKQSDVAKSNMGGFRPSLPAPFFPGSAVAGFEIRMPNPASGPVSLQMAANALPKLHNERLVHPQTDRPMIRHIVQQDSYIPESFVEYNLKLAQQFKNFQLYEKDEGLNKGEPFGGVYMGHGRRGVIDLQGHSGAGFIDNRPNPFPPNWNYQSYLDVTPHATVLGNHSNQHQPQLGSSPQRRWGNGHSPNKNHRHRNRQEVSNTSTESHRRESSAPQQQLPVPDSKSTVFVPSQIFRRQTSMKSGQEVASEAGQDKTLEDSPTKPTQAQEGASPSSNLRSFKMKTRRKSRLAVNFNQSTTLP